MSVVDISRPPEAGNLGYHGERPFLLIVDDNSFFIQGNPSDPDKFEGLIFGLLLGELRKGDWCAGGELFVDASSYLYGMILKEADESHSVFERVGVFYGPLMPKESGPWNPDLSNKYTERLRRKDVTSEGKIWLTRVPVTLV